MKQIIDEMLQGDRFLEHVLLCRCGLARVRLGDVEFEFAAHPREGAAKLVGCVGNETLLAADRIFESIEGGVHCARQPVDLVACCRFLHPSIEAGAGDVGHVEPHSFDWPQRSACQPPSEDAEDEDDAGYGESERAGQDRYRFSDVVVVGADD